MIPQLRTKIGEYPPLDTLTQDFLPTHAAAHYLGRQPQTLRQWAIKYDLSPIKPRRIAGRLAWSVADIRKMLTGKREK